MNKKPALDPTAIAMSKFAISIVDVESGSQGDVPKAISLDWDGLDDVANPKNWSSRKRLFNTVLPALFAFLMYVLAQHYTTRWHANS